MRLLINPRKVLIWLISVVLALAALHACATYALTTATPMPEGAFREVLLLFDMDQELSIPTWYAQTLLFVAASLMFLIGIAKRSAGQSYYKHWMALGCIFVYLSIDEGVSIHEILSVPLRGLLDASGGLLYFSWVAAGMIFVGCLGIIYFKFWLRLPPRTRILFLISAAIYIGGAIGVEMIGGFYFANHYIDYNYSLLVMSEESMEKIGAALLVYTLLDYMKNLQPNVTLEITKE